MAEIGAYINNDPHAAGIIINETSVLNAIDTTTTPYGTSKGNPGPPTADAAIIDRYFQNYFQAIIDARPSASKKDFLVSAGHPITTLYDYTPLNPSVLFQLHQIGEYVQDSYKADTPTPKNSTRVILIETQPYAIDACSFGANISGDVRRHKAIDATATATSTSSVSASSTGTKTFTIAEANKTFVAGRNFTAVANTNEATQKSFAGTITSWSPGAADTTNTGVLVVNATSKAGSGTAADWNIAEGANYYPPHTLDQLVEYIVEETLTGQGSPQWSSHVYKGGTHVFFQINTTSKSGTSENSRNYIEYLAYLSATSRRVKTTRPAKYPPT